VYYSAGILGTLLGIFSAILATAFCSSCLAVLFSLLGISFSMGIFFLKYKFLIFIISSILLLISLHFQSKRIIEKCKC
jgi:high-affinity Fe2+/Pb2+ permease